MCDGKVSLSASSDWEEGPLLGGGRPGHHAALQSGGGAVGEDSGLKSSEHLVPAFKRPHGNKTGFKLDFFWCVLDGLTPLLSWWRVNEETRFLTSSWILISWEIKAFSFSCSFSGFALCLKVLLPLGGSHVFVQATAHDHKHDKNKYYFLQSKWVQFNSESCLHLCGLHRFPFLIFKTI